jgi:hypothetical protein
MYTIATMIFTCMLLRGISAYKKSTAKFEITINFIGILNASVGLLITLLCETSLIK